MTALGVRRDKAAFSSGCKSHPAIIAPAGSNRSNYGGNEMVEASGEACHKIWWQRECAGRNVSERRAILEKDVAQADPTTLSGKVDMTESKSEEIFQLLCRGSSDSMYTRKTHATREARWRGRL